jgi:small-conductance mechanosensitive channel
VLAFGATALEYELWFWIEDPMTGVTNVRSAVLLALWDTFEREGVAIPKPGAAHIVLERAT